METTWGERTGKLVRLPSILWMLFLALCTAIIAPNVIGWAFVAFVAFLLHPNLWEAPKKQGIGPSVRTILAGLLAMLLAYGAWTRIDAPMPFLGSDAKAAVAASLRDPASADFRDIIVGSGATCGEVNGKNGFGGYAGFKPFVFANGVVRFEPDPPVGANVQEQTSYLRQVEVFAQAKLGCYER